MDYRINFSSRLTLGGRRLQDKDLKNLKKEMLESLLKKGLISEIKPIKNENKK